ncbi:Mrp/NBP35 family ATP-binding protein [Rhizorhapis suberifaciens]|uniref:Iron-sulfur cluster carrier protein n=1 Tax=Rhizorhapis suberifaciens TaxID=13656 RepID=A0A840HTD8_9SPHN|nr:Mrp/NBP35 family ATP-binding protein [Rhizorhapis suberifaciens]MBB4641193.1 ATP-binding protein involved in chromosome partitioning [Rhizorhapis suberifaciens]
MTDLNHIEELLQTAGKGRTSATRLKDGVLSLVLDVTGLSPMQREVLEAGIRGQMKSVEAINEVRIAMTAEKKVMRLIAVGSGKGGVGKSTLATNLAIALKRLGQNVGLVDADIYGPSQPRLLGSEGVKPQAEDKKLVPVPNAYGVPMLSMGQLAKPGQAIAWRGPMASNALTQLIDAQWGDIDVLVVDLPPGTGDVQLSMMSKHKPEGVIIVSTPQDLALIDATRAVNLFEQADIPMIGLVENMAGYACPHCGEVSDPFGTGGAEAAASTMGMPFLGRIPLDIAIRRASDAGEPPAASDDPEAAPFMAVAEKVARWMENRRR